ncbi:hypothetical protein PROPEN_03118 [Proteus penneri ATCC 35198]|nr:hypothetical protein PROPEN_03118 [Proteus penneri ATCC 35198]
MKQKIKALVEASEKLLEIAQQQAQAGAAGNAADVDASAKKDDDVVDAEFEEVDGKDKK